MDLRRAERLEDASASGDVEELSALGGAHTEGRVNAADVDLAGGSKKADWDVGLTVDAIKMSPRLDSVVIVSGDGDFVPLVEYLQTIGVQVEVVSFGKSTSGKLREVIDDFIDLSENPRKYLIGVR
jgi:uncharacterized LabA/DUF88 family protein